MEDGGRFGCYAAPLPVLAHLYRHIADVIASPSALVLVLVSVSVPLTVKSGKQRLSRSVEKQCT